MPQKIPPLTVKLVCTWYQESIAWGKKFGQPIAIIIIIIIIIMSP